MINLQEIGKKIACSGEWREKKREGDDVIGFQAARAGFIRADIRPLLFSSCREHDALDQNGTVRDYICDPAHPMSIFVSR